MNRTTSHRAADHRSEVFQARSRTPRAPHLTARGLPDAPHPKSGGMSPMSPGMPPRRKAGPKNPLELWLTHRTNGRSDSTPAKPSNRAEKPAKILIGDPPLFKQRSRLGLLRTYFLLLPGDIAQSRLRRRPPPPVRSHLFSLAGARGCLCRAPYLLRDRKRGLRSVRAVPRTVRASPVHGRTAADDRRVQAR